MYRICMVGTGYVGLVTGACLADFGNHVLCVDQDRAKLASLVKGEIPFYEFGLSEIVSRNVRENRLAFTDDLARAVRWAEVIFIAVGTPSDSRGEADLSQVFAVARTVAKHLDGYKVVVQKSTVPVGTGARVRDIIEARRKRKSSFDVASNPEFLREGSAVENFMRPDRVVIGAWTDRAMKILSDIYDPLYLNQTPMVKTTVETAELIKYASNAFLATKISFINEMANLCEKVGADVKVVARGMGLDGRIGPKFLHAGAGYGGSCFPKDTLALRSFARGAGSPLRIVSATIEVNRDQRRRMIGKIEKAIPTLRGKTIGVLGLSFKPNTDDVRDAVALDVIRALRRRGANVRAFDPVAMPNAMRVLRGVTFVDDAWQAVRGADALVIATEWNEFRRLDLPRVKRLMRTARIFDLKNVYEPEAMRALGIEYAGVGRGVPPAGRTRKRRRKG